MGMTLILIALMILALISTLFMLDTHIFWLSLLLTLFSAFWLVMISIARF